MWANALIVSLTHTHTHTLMSCQSPSGFIVFAGLPVYIISRSPGSRQWIIDSGRTIPLQCEGQNINNYITWLFVSVSQVCIIEICEHLLYSVCFVSVSWKPQSRRPREESATPVNHQVLEKMYILKPIDEELHCDRTVAMSLLDWLPRWLVVCTEDARQWFIELQWNWKSTRNKDYLQSCSFEYMLDAAKRHNFYSIFILGSSSFPIFMTAWWVVGVWTKHISWKLQENSKGFSAVPSLWSISPRNGQQLFANWSENTEIIARACYIGLWDLAE